MTTNVRDARARRPRLPAVPAEAPRWWPRFDGRLHGEAITARVGRLVGIAFGLCFLTGLISHVHQNAPTWLVIPATPEWGYRLTQGVHVITGLALIPLLLLKLFSVYPRFWEWPPPASIARVLEKATIGVLVASALFQLVTGFLNTLAWYPWHFGFVQTHYWVSWVVAGSILLHIGIKLPAIRRGLATPLESREAGSDELGDAGDTPTDTAPDTPTDTLTDTAPDEVRGAR